MKTLETIKQELEIKYAVATFNADPYCVESDEMVQEIMDEINANGVNEVVDEDERKVALAKLDLPLDSKRIVYQAGGCLFSIDDDEYDDAEALKSEDLEQANVLVEYAANLCGSERVAKIFCKEESEELSNILGDFNREWDEVEVDEEGATPEQDADLDAVLDKYQRLINAL